MPFPRMTTRRWMIAVALVGMLSAGVIEVDALYRRAAAYRALALSHGEKERVWRALARLEGDGLSVDVPPHPGAKEGRTTVRALAEREARLSAIYDRAARRPWLPVPPDTPPPE